LLLAGDEPDVVLELTIRDGTLARDRMDLAR
jgi:hypothetical protein